MDKNVTPMDEVLEDLQLAGLKILQKKTGFRFGMDAVLLADFARIGPRDTVVDFGTGTGILPLLLAGRGKGGHFTAFEIQADMAHMAERSAKLNGLGDRISVIAGDVCTAHRLLGSSCIDHVICNPPYSPPGCSIPNPRETLAMARHQGEEGLTPWLMEAMRILKGHGRFSVIYPAQRMLEIMTQMMGAHLIPKRVRMIHPETARGANLVLIEAQKEAKPLLLVEPPLIVHETDGTYTAEIQRIYHMDRES